MFFPGDPLLAIDPIFNSVPDEAGRWRLIADPALEHGVEGAALGYRFDLVLRGRGPRRWGCDHGEANAVPDGRREPVFIEFS